MVLMLRSSVDAVLVVVFLGMEARFVRRSPPQEWEGKGSYVTGKVGGEG